MRQKSSQSLEDRDLVSISVRATKERQRRYSQELCRMQAGHDNLEMWSGSKPASMLALS